MQVLLQLIENIYFRDNTVVRKAVKLLFETSLVRKKFVTN